MMMKRPGEQGFGDFLCPGRCFEWQWPPYVCRTPCTQPIFATSAHDSADKQIFAVCACILTAYATELSDSEGCLKPDTVTPTLAIVLCSALREVGLNFYDHRAVVVEVVARLNRLHAAAARREPLYERQLLALEALQVYAPMGHALGLDAASAELEDCCFQVPCRLILALRPQKLQCSLTGLTGGSVRRVGGPTACKHASAPHAACSQTLDGGRMQVLFPESYAETAAWLRKEMVANAEILRRCQMQLDEALHANAQLHDLVAEVKVSPRTRCHASRRFTNWRCDQNLQVSKLLRAQVPEQSVE